ncbi:trehalose-phosphatase [Deinococcus sp. UYEF24]
MTSPTKFLIMSDYDGTLADIVRDPAQAYPHSLAWPALRDLIGLGHEAYIVTGRRCDDVLRRLPMPAARVIGQYGLEWSETVPGEALRVQTEQVLAQLPHGPGMQVEDKGQCVTVHYRCLPSSKVNELLEQLRQVTLPDGWQVRSGKMVVEYWPAGGGKGEVVRQLLQRHPDHLGLFIGDDEADEEAFQAVQAGGGIGVKVGLAATAAMARIACVKETVRLLQDLAGHVPGDLRSLTCESHRPTGLVWNQRPAEPS